MGEVTHPKSITLTHDQLAWAIRSLKNEIGDQPWEYDRTVKRHWIGNNELGIQLELDTAKREYVIHTW